MKIRLSKELRRKLGFPTESKACRRCGVPYLDLDAFEDFGEIPGFQAEKSLWAQIVGHVDLADDFERLCSACAKGLKVQKDRILFTSVYPRMFNKERCELMHFSNAYSEKLNKELQHLLGSGLRYDCTMRVNEFKADYFEKVKGMLHGFFDVIIDLNSRCVFVKVKDVHMTRRHE